LTCVAAQAVACQRKVMSSLSYSLARSYEQHTVSPPPSTRPLGRPSGTISEGPEGHHRRQKPSRWHEARPGDLFQRAIVGWDSARKRCVAGARRSDPSARGPYSPRSSGLSPTSARAVLSVVGARQRYLHHPFALLPSSWKPTCWTRWHLRNAWEQLKAFLPPTRNPMC